MADRIVDQVSTRITQGMSTRKLYRMAFGLLHKRSHRAAARYRLKQGILDLGPSGFPFERFVARILEHDGYAVHVGVTVQGKCVSHEVDVVADKGDQHFLVECKYHNSPGRICDVKVPLYIKARFLDVAERWQQLPNNGTRHLQGWLVTNTRFTSDALQYGHCAGLRMVSWDHPETGSLRHRIDRSGLYPLTCLNSLTKAEKERLLQLGLVLVRDILERPAVLHDALVRGPRIAQVMADAEALCGAG
jgi:Holliday junction resolvase-like predicted endonuclease